MQVGQGDSGQPELGHHRRVGCAHCGRRREDPTSGPSTWRRGVLGGELVLVCPQCQVTGWTDSLDTCGSCGSTVLVKQLGVVLCRSCGAVGAPTAAEAAPIVTPDERTGGRSLLADEVAAALDRVLGRG